MECYMKDMDLEWCVKRGVRVMPKLESMLKNKDWSWPQLGLKRWLKLEANWLWFPLEM